LNADFLNLQEVLKKEDFALKQKFSETNEKILDNEELLGSQNVKNTMLEKESSNASQVTAVTEETDSETEKSFKKDAQSFQMSEQDENLGKTTKNNEETEESVVVSNLNNSLEQAEKSILPISPSTSFTTDIPNIEHTSVSVVESIFATDQAITDAIEECEVNSLVSHVNSIEENLKNSPLKLTIKKDQNNNPIVERPKTKSGNVIFENGMNFPAVDYRSNPSTPKVLTEKKSKISSTGHSLERYTIGMTDKQLELRANHISCLIKDLESMHKMVINSKIVDHRRFEIAQNLLVKINQLTVKLRKHQLRPTIKQNNNEKVILPDHSYTPAKIRDTDKSKK